MTPRPSRFARAFLFVFLAQLFLFVDARAAAMPKAQANDLNGAHRRLPEDLPDGRTVLIFGFSHGASTAMDRWVQDLQLNDNSSGWLELPVVGAVTTMVRPMIRGGMKAQYKTKLSRAHVIPVFDGGPDIAASLKPVADDIVVIVVDRGGEIIARADGASTPAKVGAVSQMMRGQ